MSPVKSFQLPVPMEVLGIGYIPTMKKKLSGQNSLALLRKEYCYCYSIASFWLLTTAEILPFPFHLYKPRVQKPQQRN